MSALTYVRTDGRGRVINVEVCTCEVSAENFAPDEDWIPTDDTCPLYDRHLELQDRITRPLPEARL
jgi:hypothetical protein